MVTVLLASNWKGMAFTNSKRRSYKQVRIANCLLSKLADCLLPSRYKGLVALSHLATTNVSSCGSGTENHRHKSIINKQSVNKIALSEGTLFSDQQQVPST